MTLFADAKKPVRWHRDAPRVPSMLSFRPPAEGY